MRRITLMRRIILVLVVAAVVAAMVQAGPVSADPVNSCKSHSFESECQNFEPEFVLNYGTCQAAAVTELGGQVAKERVKSNPSINDGNARVCNPDQ